MVMLEILLSVCLHTDATRCKEDKIPVMAETSTPFECMRFGAYEIVKWTEHHPRWQVAKWTCVQAGRSANT
jgi:hypothetical protein